MYDVGSTVNVEGFCSLLHVVKKVYDTNKFRASGLCHLHDLFILVHGFWLKVST